ALCLLVISVGVGFLFSIVGQTIILISGAYTLWLAWIRNDQLSAILVRAAGVLVAAIGILYLRWSVTLFWPECPDIEPFGMSIFQAGVLVESLILLAGLLVHDRQSRADTEQKNQARIQKLRQQLTVRATAKESYQPLSVGKGRFIDLNKLEFLRTKKKDWFVAYYADGSSETYPIRLSHAEKSYFSKERLLVRHHNSSMVWLPAISYYHPKGRHEIKLKNRSEILTVSARFRESFALEYNQFKKSRE
ncbi:MAG: hypothetical protein AAFY36_19680, partial [Bacteroidota bacterium]